MQKEVVVGLDTRCIVCNIAEWNFDAYIPECEDSESSRIGASFYRNNMDPNSKLFKVLEKPDVWSERDEHQFCLRITEVKLAPNLNPKHGGRLKVPDFGHHVGQTVWVCQYCWNRWENNRWFSGLDAVGMDIWAKVEGDYNRLAGLLFTHGIIPLKKNLENFWLLPEKIQKDIIELIGKLHKTLPNANPQKINCAMVKNIKKLYRVSDRQVALAC